MDGSSAQPAMKASDQTHAYTRSGVTDSDEITREADPANDVPAVTNSKIFDFDQFRAYPDKQASTSETNRFDKSNRAVTFVVCAALFLFVLMTATFSKFTLLHMLYTINPLQLDTILHASNETIVLKRSTGRLDASWVWALLLVIVSPYFFTFISSLYTLCRKACHACCTTQEKDPTQKSCCKSELLKTLMFNVIVETVHTVSLLAVVYIVLPSFDPFVGSLLMLNINTVPVLLRLVDDVYVKYFRRCSNNATDSEGDDQNTAGTRIRVKFLSLDIIMLLVQGVVLVLFAWRTDRFYGNPALTGLVLVTFVVTSLTWWPSSVAGKYSFLYTGKTQSRQYRKQIGVFVSLWKIIVSFAGVLVIFAEGCPSVLFYPGVLSGCSIFGNLTIYHGTSFESCSSGTPYILAAISILSSGCCYICGKKACKVGAPKYCFALPLYLSSFFVFVLFVVFAATGSKFLATISECDLPWMPSTEDFERLLHSSEFMEVYDEHMWLPLGIISYLVCLMTMGRHAWELTDTKLARNCSLFSKSLYCGIFLDSSLIFNTSRDKDSPMFSKPLPRRRYPEWVEKLLESSASQAQTSTNSADGREKPMVYVCATMWHETKREMTQMIESLLRLDKYHHQKERQDTNQRQPQDDFNFEAHIFFDDAFADDDDSQTEGKYLNDYVEMLMEVIPEATKAHSTTRKTTSKNSPDETDDSVTTATLKRVTVTPYGGQLTWKLPHGSSLVVHLKDKALIRKGKRWSQVMSMYYFLSHILLRSLDKSTVHRAQNTFLLALDGDVDFQPEALRRLIQSIKSDDDIGATCGRIHPTGTGPMVWYQVFEYAVSHWLQKATEHVLGCVLCSPGCFSLFSAYALMDDNVLRKYTTTSSEARHYVQYDQGEDRWLCTLLLQRGYRVEYCAASDSYTRAPGGFFEFCRQRRRWIPSTIANIIDLLQNWRGVTKWNRDISVLYIAYQAALLVGTILTPGTIFLLIMGALTAAFPSIPLFGSLLINLTLVVVFVVACFFCKPQAQLQWLAVMSVIYTLLMMMVLVGMLAKAVEFGICSITTIFTITILSIFVLAAVLHPQEICCIFYGLLYFLLVPCMSMLLVFYSIINLHVVSWGTREAAEQRREQEEEQGCLQRLLSFGFIRCVCCCSTQANDNEHVPQPAHGRDLSSMESGNAACSLNRSYESVNTDPRERKRLPFPNNFTAIREELDSDETKFWTDLIRRYLEPPKQNGQKEKKVERDLTSLRSKSCVFFFLINGLFVVLFVTLSYVSETTRHLIIHMPCNTEFFRGEDFEPISMAFMLVFGIFLVLQFFGMLRHRINTLLHIAADTDLKKTKKNEEAKAKNKADGDSPGETSESTRVESDEETLVKVPPHQIGTVRLPPLFKTQKKINLPAK